jgi:hypothetical protein
MTVATRPRRAHARSPRLSLPGYPAAVSGDWLARYRAGEHGQVWDELAQLGSAVRDPELVGEIQLVCDEMARAGTAQRRRDRGSAHP